MLSLGKKSLCCVLSVSLLACSAGPLSEIDETEADAIRKADRLLVLKFRGYKSAIPGPERALLPRFRFPSINLSCSQPVLDQENFDILAKASFCSTADGQALQERKGSQWLTITKSDNTQYVKMVSAQECEDILSGKTMLEVPTRDCSAVMMFSAMIANTPAVNAPAIGWKLVLSVVGLVVAGATYLGTRNQKIAIVQPQQDPQLPENVKVAIAALVSVEALVVDGVTIPEDVTEEEAQTGLEHLAGWVATFTKQYGKGQYRLCVVVSENMHSLFESGAEAHYPGPGWEPCSQGKEPCPFALSQARSARRKAEANMLQAPFTVVQNMEIMFNQCLIPYEMQWTPTPAQIMAATRFSNDLLRDWIGKGFNPADYDFLTF